MNELHKHLQKFVGDLQQLLAENSDDSSLVTAIKQKWPDGDSHRYFLLGLQNKISPQGGRKSLQGIGDMGGDGGGPRDNELKEPLGDMGEDGTGPRK